jgi:mannose-6-phosphate isomerase-like protein (cupin superfamily)
MSPRLRIVHCDNIIGEFLSGGLPQGRAECSTSTPAASIMHPMTGAAAAERTREGRMTVKVRRVVTGHDAAGKAVVVYDEISDNVVSGRPGQSAAVIWQTSEFPSDNNKEGDLAKIPVKTVNPKGTVFRVVEYQPGVAGRVHRTDSIDYGIVLAGEMVMELDDAEVHLSAGDCIVQRGTIHNWVNRGAVPCVVAYVLVAADPAMPGGKVLPAVG